jgi:hypothetical protein
VEAGHDLLNPDASEQGPSINLLTSADFSSMTAKATHGLDRYVAPGGITFARAVVPEPPTMLMIAPLVATALAFRRRFNRTMMRGRAGWII